MGLGLKLLNPPFTCNLPFRCGLNRTYTTHCPQNYPDRRINVLLIAWCYGSYTIQSIGHCCHSAAPNLSSIESWRWRQKVVRNHAARTTSLSIETSNDGWLRRAPVAVQCGPVRTLDIIDGKVGCDCWASVALKLDETSWVSLDHHTCHNWHPTGDDGRFKNSILSG